MTIDETGIAVWTIQPPPKQAGKSALPIENVIPSVSIRVDPNTLAKNVRQFLESLRSVFDDISRQGSAYDLDQIELNLVVNASGGLELIGKLSMGTQASIKLLLKRKEQAASEGREHHEP